MKNTTTLRQQIIETVTNRLQPLPFVDALWEAGSAAFDAVDDYSDIDLMIVVADDAVEQTFNAVDAALREISPISDRFRIPEPTWHGHSQIFYKLQGAGDYLQIDCVVMKASSENRFLEPELHGRPRILFDKTGAAEPAPFDWEAHNRLLAKRIGELTERFGRMQVYVKKGILRRHEIDAFAFYRPMTLNPLIELLRIKHDPARHSWGLRYLHRHLSISNQARLTDLLYLQDLYELEEQHAIAQKWFWRLAKELKEKYPEE